MKSALTKAVTHREFLRMCGLAIVGAGAGQLVVPSKPAAALYQINDDLYVSGKVGIGTATPASRLDVNGTISINGVAAIDGNGVAKQSYYA